MKVIRQGVIPEQQPMQATCSHCNAVIEFKPEEVRRVSDQRDGDFYQFACPCCGRPVTKQCGRGYFGPG